MRKIEEIMEDQLVELKEIKSILKAMETKADQAYKDANYEMRRMATRLEQIKL